MVTNVMTVNVQYPKPKKYIHRKLIFIIIVFACLILMIFHFGIGFSYSYSGVKLMFIPWWPVLFVTLVAH